MAKLLLIQEAQKYNKVLSVRNIMKPPEIFVFLGSDMTIDDRSFVMQAVMTMDIPSSVSFFYPRLIPLHDIKPSVDDKIEIPPLLRCTIEKMSDQGVYLLGKLKYFETLNAILFRFLNVLFRF